MTIAEAFSIGKKLQMCIVLVSVSAFLAACGANSTSSTTGLVNPRDTVTVPAGLTGEDSIAYIENTIMHSPISAGDLLSLAEVHTLEDMFSYYNNFELAKEHPEYAEHYLATPRDSAAMRLANRFMRMYYMVTINGSANDKLQWAEAVNAALDAFHKEVPSVASDSTLSEIARVTSKFSSLTQSEMNLQSYIYASVAYYQTIEDYRQWLAAVPDELKDLAHEEYEAWHDLNEARFSFWNDVSYTQTWYSAKPMEIEGYYEYLSRNRCAELNIERSVVLEGKTYSQKGVTVTAEQWEQWIDEHSAPEDMEELLEMGLDYYMPEDSIVSVRVSDLKSTFSKWIAARQAIAAALPKEQGTSYDNLTADIYSRIVGRLSLLIDYEPW